MRLEKRNNGTWVIVAKHCATGQECEAPFEVVEKRDGFELWSYASENDDEMTLHESRLSKKGVLDWAETMLPAEMSA